MRSLLFVPADGGSKLDKALASGADAMIIDLEDSIAPDRKVQARESAAAFLRNAASAAKRPRLLVRVNAIATGLIDADLDAVVPARPDAILLPITLEDAEARAEYLADRRGRLVELTTKGRQLVDKSVVDHFANEKRLLSGLSASDREKLADLLRKLLVSEPFHSLDPARRAPAAEASSNRSARKPRVVARSRGRR